MRQLRYAHHVDFAAVGRVALEGHGNEGVGVDVLTGDVQVTLAAGAAGEGRWKGERWEVNNKIKLKGMVRY